jgi:hypothetical protein
MQRNSNNFNHLHGDIFGKSLRGRVELQQQYGPSHSLYEEFKEDQTTFAKDLGDIKLFSQ